MKSVYNRHQVKAVLRDNHNRVVALWAGVIATTAPVTYPVALKAAQCIAEAGALTYMWSRCPGCGVELPVANDRVEEYEEYSYTKEDLRRLRDILLESNVAPPEGPLLAEVVRKLHETADRIYPAIVCPHCDTEMGLVK